MVFKNAVMWPDDDPASMSPSNLGHDQVGVYITDFEFVGPSAVLIPDNVSVVPKPLMGPNGWVPSAMLVPQTKWCALVDGHKKAEKNGSWASSCEVLILGSSAVLSILPIS